MHTIHPRATRDEAECTKKNGGYTAAGFNRHPIRGSGGARGIPAPRRETNIYGRQVYRGEAFTDVPKVVTASLSRERAEGTWRAF